MVLGVLRAGVGGVVAQQVEGDRQQLLHHAVVRDQRAQAGVLLQESLQQIVVIDTLFQKSKLCLLGVKMNFWWCKD
jgi:hypothetical protein